MCHSAVLYLGNLLFRAIFHAAGDCGAGLWNGDRDILSRDPFAFYAIAAVIIVPLFIVGVVPKLGRMRTAYRRLQETGKVYSPESAPLNEEDESEFQTQGSLMDFILPVGVLIILAIISGELFLAVVAAIAVCFVLYIPRGKMSFSRFCDLAMHGFAT